MVLTYMHRLDKSINTCSERMLCEIVRTWIVSSFFRFQPLVSNQLNDNVIVFVIDIFQGEKNINTIYIFVWTSTVWNGTLTPRRFFMKSAAIPDSGEAGIIKT